MMEIKSGIKRADGFVWLKDAWEALPEDSIYRQILPPPGAGSHYAGYGDSIEANSFFDQIHYVEANMALKKPEQLIIGNYCCIGSDTIFMLGGNQGHPMTAVSQHPLFHLDTAEWRNMRYKGNIVIEDDVWIGRDVTIMSGVTIGQGARIQAGATVVKNVPPYAKVGGVAAKIKGYRFAPEEIKTLMTKIRWTEWPESAISENVALLLDTKPDWKKLTKVADELEKQGLIPSSKVSHNTAELFKIFDTFSRTR